MKDAQEARVMKSDSITQAERGRAREKSCGLIDLLRAGSLPLKGVKKPKEPEWWCKPMIPVAPEAKAAGS